MNLFGECVVSHTSGATVVHRDKSGMVSPEWLSACKEERTSTMDLMNRVIDPLNMEKAYKRVLENGGISGIDGMEVEELRAWLGSHYEQLRSQLLNGTYHPSGVRGVRIRKPHGGYRQLGIPTVIDRLIQQALHQVMSPQYERSFSASSHGFRPNRSAHGALLQALQYVSLGKQHVVDLDLEKFFDEVNHHRLMWLLGTRIGDSRILKLIHRYLKCGLLSEGLMQQREKGTPQGSPLSPLLSNIVLDELDKELERRGQSYVRYADDVKIFVSSRRAATQLKEKLTSYIEEVLKLRVNREKSRVCKSHELNFLGHSIVRQKGGTVLGISRPSLERLKGKIRQLTRRNRGVSFERVLSDLQVYCRGWLIYFRYAKMQRYMERIDSWLRHKLKCYRLKQCKRVIGIFRFLRKLGIPEYQCWITAKSGKGWWRLSNSPSVTHGMTNEWFIQQGFYSLSHNYKALHRKLL
ncbi:MAG TPA: group II intron reverse transcriptase/maturase [Chitinophaga sp.]|uniref:group II intron reverse transcriptase/maturase n=1 Tax=Chitinophaga sp. TaxID=1869181 RepID=UPI002CA8D209|nr:group II intron reverse transcriptase/maturase [Chitinophaga sp.]HVI49416.1 group II intron reverse transcriptase/maturase [Chitinophaga sp.]